MSAGTPAQVLALPLDHVVTAVNDLDATITDYRTLGFNVLRGGDHPGRPTHNALVVFADGSYFELIAWREPAPADRWWQLLQQHGEGIIDFALLPPGTATTVAAAQARGLALSGPHDGGRVRPDGEQLRWQTARPPSHDLPFLCGDLTPRALRVPEGEARVHPNGAIGVASLSIAVHNLPASLGRYRALLGEPPQGAPASHASAAVDLPHSDVQIGLVRAGASTLVLGAPRSGEGALARHLATRGEGPYALVLARKAEGAAPVLDPARAHGASIRF